MRFTTVLCVLIFSLISNAASAQQANLMFVSQPLRGTVDAPLSEPFVLQIVDDNNQVIVQGPDSTAVVSLAFSRLSPTKGEIEGTAAAAAVNGVVVFSSVSFNLAGTKILMATKADTTGLTGGSPAALARSKKLVISRTKPNESQSQVSF